MTATVNTANLRTVRDWLAKLTPPRHGPVGEWFSHKAEYLHKAMREWGDGADMFAVARRIDPKIEYAVISQSGHVVRGGWVTPGTEPDIVSAWLEELDRVIRSTASDAASAGGSTSGDPCARAKRQERSL